MPIKRWGESKLTYELHYWKKPLLNKKKMHTPASWLCTFSACVRKFGHHTLIPEMWMCVDRKAFLLQPTLNLRCFPLPPKYHLSCLTIIFLSFATCLYISVSCVIQLVLYCLSVFLACSIIHFTLEQRGCLQSMFLTAFRNVGEKEDPWKVASVTLFFSQK